MIRGSHVADPHRVRREHDREKVVAFGQSRWMKGNQRYPLWVDNPAELWTRRFIPVRLLQPEEIMAEIGPGQTPLPGTTSRSRDLETEILPSADG